MIYREPGTRPSYEESVPKKSRKKRMIDFIVRFNNLIQGLLMLFQAAIQTALYLEGRQPLHRSLALFFVSLAGFLFALHIMGRNKT